MMRIFLRVLFIRLVVFVGFLILVGEHQYFSFNLRSREVSVFAGLLVFINILFLRIVKMNSFFYRYVVLECLGFLTLFVISFGVRNHNEGLLKYYVGNRYASLVFVCGVGVVRVFDSGGIGGAFLVEKVSIDDNLGGLLGNRLIFVALIRKLGIYPLSRWRLDAYSSLQFSAFVVVIVLRKVPYFVFLLRWLRTENILLKLFPRIRGIALVSIIGGALGAAAQILLQRLLVYSSFNQMGYILMFLVLGVDNLVRFGYGTRFFLLYIRVRILFSRTILKVIGGKRDLAGSGKLTFLEFVAAVRKLSFGWQARLVICLLTFINFPIRITFLPKFGLVSVLVRKELYRVGLFVRVAGVLTIFYYIRLRKIRFRDFNVN